MEQFSNTGIVHVFTPLEAAEQNNFRFWSNKFILSTKNYLRLFNVKLLVVDIKFNIIVYIMSFRHIDSPPYCGAYLTANPQYEDQTDPVLNDDHEHIGALRNADLLCNLHC